MFAGMAPMQMRNLLYVPFDSLQAVRFSVDTAPCREVETLETFHRGGDYR